MADRFPLIANSSANQIQELAAADQLDLTGSNLVLGDSTGANNNRIKIGAGGDIVLYHNATHSYLTNATNDLNIECTTNDAALILKANHIHLKDETNQSFLKGIENTGAVEAFYGGNKKFETTSGGVNVTGALTVNGSALTSKLIDYKMKEYGRGRYQIGNVGSYSEMDSNFRLSHTPAAVGNTIIVTFHIQFNLSNNTYGGMTLVTDQGSNSDEAMLGASTSGSGGRTKADQLSNGWLNESIRNASGSTNWEFMQGWGYHITENTNSHIFKVYARLGNGDFYVGDNQFAQTMQLWEYQGNCISSQIV